MKTPKIKRYRMPVSRTFPQRHPRAGEPTFFVDRILAGQTIQSNMWMKIHTIRASKVWIERMKEVQAGRAVIELFYWSGKPYHKDENGIGQVVFATLDKDSGCGVQELKFDKMDWSYAFVSNVEKADLYPRTLFPAYNVLAKNDGLSIDDFKAWFKGYDLSEPMVIVHFTSFRY